MGTDFQCYLPLGDESDTRALDRRGARHVRRNRRGSAHSPPPSQGRLGVGFCAAISPVIAQVTTTSADGLLVGEVKVRAGDVDIPAYRAMPDRGGPFPTVLVVHEAFGVHEHIKDICRRFARLGYYAISPELFARQGDAAAEPNMSKLMATIVYKKPDSEAAGDLDATLAFAESTGSADAGRAAVVGFCWGGRQVWLYAGHNPALKAAVAWYGPLLWRVLQPTTVARAERDPPDVVGDLRVPVLGLYGGTTPSFRSPRSR